MTIRLNKMTILMNNHCKGKPRQTSVNLSCYYDDVIRWVRIPWAHSCLTIPDTGLQATETPEEWMWSWVWGHKKEHWNEKCNYGEKSKIIYKHSANVRSVHHGWITEMFILSEPFGNERVVCLFLFCSEVFLHFLLPGEAFENRKNSGWHIEHLSLLFPLYRWRERFRVI